MTEARIHHEIAAEDRVSDLSTRPVPFFPEVVGCMQERQKRRAGENLARA